MEDERQRVAVGIDVVAEQAVGDVRRDELRVDEDDVAVVRDRGTFVGRRHVDGPRAVGTRSSRRASERRAAFRSGAGRGPTRTATRRRRRRGWPARQAAAPPGQRPWA